MAKMLVLHDTKHETIRCNQVDDYKLEEATVKWMNASHTVVI